MAAGLWCLLGGLLGLGAGMAAAAYLYSRDLLPDEAAYGDGVLTVRVAMLEGGLIGLPAGILLALRACMEGQRMKRAGGGPGLLSQVWNAVILGGVCVLFISRKWVPGLCVSGATLLVMLWHSRRFPAAGGGDDDE